MPTMTETSTSIAPATSDTMQDDSSEDDHHQQEEDSTPVKRSQSAPSLSKSWSIQSAHVPTYTGGKIEVCHGKGILVDSDDDDRAAAPVPFLLLPVSNDLAIVDAQRGVKMRTIRVGDDGAINDDAVDDDEDEEGVDADAIICYALSSNDQILITASRNQLLRQYNLTSMSTWKSTQPAPVQKLWGRSGHSLPITCMAFHMSNVFLATGSVDGTVRIWDVRGAYCTHVYRPIQSDESSSGGMHGVSSITWRNDISHLVLAIGRDDGGITIHDLRASSRSNSQTAIAVLRDHVSAVTSMEWCAEDVFVSAGRDAVLNTWQIERETSTKKKKGKTPGPPRLVYKRIHTLPIYEQVEGMVVLASRMVSEITVATAGSKGVVRIWKAQHEKTPSKVVVSGFTCLVEQTESESFGSDRGGYMQLKYNRGEQGDRFVVADAEHNLSFLSLAIDKESPSLSVDRTIVGHNDEILDLKIIPMLPTSEESKAQSTRIAVATNSAQVRLFDLKSFSCDVLDGHRATVLCVDVSPCGRYLATCGKDNTMRLWHLGSHRCIAVATGHTEAVGSTTLSRKLGRYEVTGKAASNGAGCFAVTASKDRTIKRWNLPGATELDACGVSDNADMLQLGAFASARAHDKDINIVSVAPNDSLVATGSQDKTVRLWKSTDLTLQATLRGHRRGVWDCQFSPFDRVVATASGDRTVKLWSLGDYSCVRTFQGHVASALRVRFLCGGLQLLSSGADGLVKLWTIRTNECVGTMDGHIDKVWALDMSSDGSTFVSGGADSRIVIWNDTTQAEENMKRATEEQNILMEQKLANHLRFKEYEQALEIALQLEKPLQALKVLNSIVENDVQKGQSGLETLQRHVKGWSMARTTQILRYCRDWNTRARNCHMSMLVLKAIVSTIPAHTLAAAEGVPEILAGITPYAERHFDRLDRLHASTYLLDFALFSMGNLDMEQDDAKAFAEWESKSKMVLPPKQTDGRIQVGGTAFVGRDAQGVAEDDDEVVTIGESDSSDDDESSSTSETSEDDDNNNVGVADEQGGHSKKGQDFSSSSSESDSETS